MPTPVSAGPIRRAGRCLQPVLLRGRVDYIDGGTGELVHRYTTVHEPGGVLPIACKTRRASRCPPCAEVYRADTYQLIRAGLTAARASPPPSPTTPACSSPDRPSFGPVHAVGRRTAGCWLAARAGKIRPARTASACLAPRSMTGMKPAGRAAVPRLLQLHRGGPVQRLRPRTVAPVHYHLCRTLARQAGLTVKALAGQLRVSYAKVAEYQQRGVVHFHAIIRLDALRGQPTPRPPGPPPPCSPRDRPRRPRGQRHDSRRAGTLGPHADLEATARHPANHCSRRHD